MDQDKRIGDSQTFLAGDEPAAYTRVHAGSVRPLLLVCDHASDYLPRALGDLGLEPAARRSHRALDIGAAALARMLSKHLQATAVLAGYSRLVVDCNRALDDPQAFVTFTDGVAIPGNRNLDVAHKRMRAQAVYWPYHRAVDAEIARLRECAPDQLPAVLAVHSFTPTFEGTHRPWQVGILWSEDARVAAPLMDGLRRAGLVVGDNQPYSARTGRLNHTLHHHAQAAGLANACIEVRHDLLTDAAGVTRMADVIAAILQSLPASVHARGQSVPARAAFSAHATATTTMYDGA